MPRPRRLPLLPAAAASTLAAALCWNLTAADALAQEDGQPRTVVAKKSAEAAAEPLPVLPDPPTAPPVADLRLRLPREQHPWARFEPGAWRTLQIVTESFDPAGKFLGRSETTQTETLVSLADETYTLETRTVVNVGGKRLRGAAQQMERHLLTDTADVPMEVERLPVANLSLDNRTIPCERWQIVFGEGQHRRMETIYYHADLAPHILRREVAAADGTGESTIVASTTAVVRADMPVTIDEEIVPGRHVSIVTQSGTHRVERTEVQSDVAPGGLVSARSVERDATGRRVRWTTVELVDFGVSGEPPKPRWRLFRRRGERP